MQGVCTETLDQDPILTALGIFQGKQRHPQSDGAGNTRYQTTRAPQEDMAPTNQGRHDVRRCYPGCGPRPEGVEEKDKADP